MARVRSTNPVGVTPRDVAPDAPIYARWLRAAVGDTALAHDLITGANSTTAIDHSGAPLGCPLRMPLAAQAINRDVSATSAGDYYILAVPVFVRAGETDTYSLRMSVTPGGADDMTLEVRDSTFAILSVPLRGEVEEPPVRGDGTLIPINRVFVVKWNFTIYTAGIYYVFVKRRCTDTNDRFFSWSLDNARPSAGSTNGLFVDGSTLVGSPYNALSTYSVANNIEFYDEEVTAYTMGLSAYVTSRLNRKLNALWEYVTGSRIPGNNAYQGTSTVSNNRSTWANEALLEFPMTVAALGASAAITGAKNPSASDMQGWIRYPVSHSTTPASFCGLNMFMPNFRTSTSDLKCTVLFQASTGDSMADWRFDVNVSGSASGQFAPTQLGASKYWTATVTGIPFTAGVSNLVDVRIRHTTGSGTIKHAQMLGVCLYFDP
jgi:hypothetical protein